STTAHDKVIAHRLSLGVTQETLIVPNMLVGWIVQLKYSVPGGPVLNVSFDFAENGPVSSIFAAAVFAVASACDFQTVNVCGTPVSLLSTSIVIAELVLSVNSLRSNLMLAATTVAFVTGPAAIGADDGFGVGGTIETLL